MRNFATRDNISSAVSVSGSLIRYTFYATGALAFGLIAFVIIKVSGFASSQRVSVVDQGPSFRLVDSALNRLPMQSKVTNVGTTGRIEVRQYGRPHDRAANMSIALIVAPADGVVRSKFADVRTSLTMNGPSPAISGSERYDFETRFGPIRATAARFNSDGLIKPCLVFYSRFETDAVRLEGTMCEADGSKPNPHGLACILDGLVLDSRLPPPAADSFLRERMGRRPYCTSVPVSQTIDTQTRPIAPSSRWSTPSAQRR